MDDAMKSFEELINDKDPAGTKEPNYILPYTLEELGLVFDDSDVVVSAIDSLEADILVKSVSDISGVKAQIIGEVRSEFVALHTNINIDSLSSIFKIKGELTYENYIKLVKSIVKKSGLFYQIYAGTEEQKSQLRDTIFIHFSKVFGIDAAGQGASGQGASASEGGDFEDVQIEIVMEHVDKYLKFMQKIIKLLTKYNTYTLIEEWDNVMSDGSQSDNLVVFVLDDFLSNFTRYFTDLNHKSTEQFLTKKNSEDVNTLKSLQAEGAFLNTGAGYEAFSVSGTAVAFVTGTEGGDANSLVKSNLTTPDGLPSNLVVGLDSSENIKTCLDRCTAAINTAYNELFSAAASGVTPKLDFLVNRGTLNKIVVPTTEDAATQILAENTELDSKQELNFAKISANSIWVGPNDIYGPDISFYGNKKTEFERRGGAARANLIESVAISSSGGLVVKIPAAIVECAYSDKKGRLQNILKKFCDDISESRNNLTAYRAIKKKRQEIVEEAQKEIIDKVKKNFSKEWRKLEADLASDAHDERQLDYLVFACLYEEQGDFVEETIMEVAEKFVQDSERRNIFL